MTLDTRATRKYDQLCVRLVPVTDRIIASPYASKRLMMLLDGVVKEYEKRFGALNVEGPTPR